MGIVEEVGSRGIDLKVGDRVVIPFQISCGHCFMCDQQLYTQCETTQVRDQGMGAALFGYSKLYGEVPGGQAEYLRVPHAQFTHIKVPEGPPDSPFRLPVRCAADGVAGRRVRRRSRRRSVAVLGLGPIGDMAARIAQHRGIHGSSRSISFPNGSSARQVAAASRPSTSTSTTTISATSSAS